MKKKMRCDFEMRMKGDDDGINQTLTLCLDKEFQNFKEFKMSRI